MTDARLEDRAALGELLASYSWALVDRDWDRWSGVFSDDATVDYSTAGGPAGAPADALAWLRPTLEMFDVALSQNSNLTITFDADDRASLRSLYTMTMRIPGAEGAEPTYLQASGWYDDVAVRTTAGWRLSSRREQLCYVRSA
jgi:SnoaL-like domain